MFASPLVLFATGAATGLLGSMLGLGGGVLLVPLLTLWLGVPIRVTIGNALTKDGVIEVRTRRDGREVRGPQDRVVDTVVGLRATRAGEEVSAAG